MNILIVEPSKQPYAKEISGDLESLQTTVGGYIQAIYTLRMVSLLEIPSYKCYNEQKFLR
jgi:hypothetical protein